MWDYINDNFWTLIAVFAVSTVLFLLLIFSVFPWVVRRLPETFFVDDAAEMGKKNSVHYVLRNLLGLVMVVAGPIVMLPFIILPPGSGLLVMVMGIGLMDFPGKRKQLRRCLRSSNVRRLLNWMRISARLRPFILPEDFQNPESPE